MAAVPPRQERVQEPQQIWPNPSTTRADGRLPLPGGMNHGEPPARPLIRVDRCATREIYLTNPATMENPRPVPWSRVYEGSRRNRGPAAGMEIAPANLREVARSARLLRIDGFSLLPEASPVSMDGHFVKTTWSIYGHDWEVRFYPSMKVPYHKFSSWLAVELDFPSTTSEGEARMGVKLSCRLIHPKGKQIPTGADSDSGVSGPSAQSIVAFLLPRMHLAKSGYLKHDSVTIECTIVVHMRSPDMTVLPAKEAPAPPSNLNLDLAQLQQSKTGADVTFLVSGESFDAHKLILAARSPVFSSEFFGSSGEKSAQQIQVEGIDASAFKAMLSFIYTDTVSEFDQPSEAATELAKHLVAAADRYGLDRLKMISEAKLYDTIKTGTVAITLAFAQQHNCLQLKAKCMDYIVSTPDILDEVLATDGYTHLVASHPSVLRDLLMSARGRKRQKQGI